MDEVLALCLRARRDPAALAAVEARAAAHQIDWDRLAGCAATERLGPLLDDILGDADFVPPAVREDWQQAYRASALFYVVWSNALARVSTALAAEQIPFIVLKGAALAQTIYEKAALRPLADIDILVPRDRVSATVAALQANGYQPPRAAESEDYTLHFENELPVSPRHPIGAAIDIHWSLFDSPYYQRALSHDWFWQSSVLLPGYGAARMLGPEAQLLHLSTHLMVHHHGKGVLWLYDIVELLHRHGEALDWDLALVQAQRSELVQSLQQTAERAIEELEAAVPPARRAQLRELSPSPQERYVFSHPTIGTTTPEHFWNDVVTLPSWRARAGYVAARVAPAPAFMRQRYRLRTSAWLPLYYPYRWLSGAWQFAGVFVSRLAPRSRRDTNNAFSERESWRR
jgi:hypothetical protein